MLKTKRTPKYLRIPKKNHEDYLLEMGYQSICGLDEVGRGAWAGPLVVGAVILSKRFYKLRDSKLLLKKNRESLARKIKKTCFWGIGKVSSEEIDKFKLTKATQLAFLRALRNLKVKPDFILIDGTIPLLYPERARASRMGCRALKNGDMICQSIAAASIIAKVYRDRLMCRLDKKIKGYKFCQHKGYGTKLHQNRLQKLDPSKIHRRSFLPIKRLTKAPK